MRRQEEETTINIKEDAAPTSCWAADITKDYKEYAASGSLAVAGGGRSLKCIFKWPHDLEKLLGEDIYREPQMVAIGPYHHGRPHLQPMERHKKNALFRILRLSGGLPVSIFVEPLKQVEQKLRDHYDELDPSWSSDSFIQMMLLDGCFLLDFLLALDKKVDAPLAESIRLQLLNTYGYAVFIRDIQLLENQIPGLVLDELINVGDWTGFRKPESGSKLSFRALHFLDLQRKSLLGNPPAPVKEQHRCGLLNLLGPRRRTQPKTFPSSSQQADKQSTSNMDFAVELLPKREKYVRSATKLRAAGVSFQKCPKDAGLLSVSFDRSWLRGVLHLPELVLDETTEGVFMNMVAFERMHPESGTQVTSFLSFMDALIDTADDVSFLGNEGIVKNNLGSDEAASKIFNKLGIHGMCNPFDEAQQKVQKYASPYMQEWWAHFKRTHFTSPWTVLSFIGALFFILITIVQTAYTVLPYYKRRG
ncbi:UPF0481 protein At3g47200-like [Nymphaea colorata]|nr:UPF0481 protein At3g47200-like [Nymphaea colorata]